MSEIMFQYTNDCKVESNHCIKPYVFANYDSFYQFRGSLPLITSRVDPNPNSKNVISDRFENIDGILSALMEKKGHFNKLASKEVDRRMGKLQEEADNILNATKANVRENKKIIDSRRLLFINSLYQVFRDCILSFQMALGEKKDAKYTLDPKFALMCKPLIECITLPNLIPKVDFFDDIKGYTAAEKMIPMCTSIYYLKENLTKLENEFASTGKICNQNLDGWLSAIKNPKNK